MGIARILRSFARRLNAERYRREVTLAYEAVLHRSPDPEGMAGYLGNVLGGRQSITDVMKELLGSAERHGLSRRSIPANTHDLVRQLYQTILGRDPDAAGLAAHVQRIESGQTTIADLVHEFLSSAEFANRISLLPGVANRLAPEFGNRGSSAVSGVVDRDIALLAAELIAAHLGDEGSSLSLPPLQQEGVAVVPARTMASLLHTLAMLGRSRNAIAGATA